MKETERIKKLFDDLYAGSPWIDVTIADTLAAIDHKQAAKKINGRNSIWEIVNHMISWRENVLQRLEGHPAPAPDHNYFTPLQDVSGEAWKLTLRRFQASQADWLDKISNIGEDSLETIYRGNKLTYYEHIQGILQHDAYHLGQIVLLSKINE